MQKLIQRKKSRARQGGKKDIKINAKWKKAKTEIWRNIEWGG